MLRVLLVLSVFALTAVDCQGRPWRRSKPVQQPVEQWVSVSADSVVVQTGSAVPATSALDEVNAARAARGLRPFLHDQDLQIAAERCAAVRAANGIKGHTSNDFQSLPNGATAKAAGCGALDPSWGFQACCVYDGYTHAGAATVAGRDGKLYHQIFVR